jgi:hypothetical protein
VTLLRRNREALLANGRGARQVAGKLRVAGNILIIGFRPQTGIASKWLQNPATAAIIWVRWRPFDPHDPGPRPDVLDEDGAC